MTTIVEKRRALGRGLESLLPGRARPVSTPPVVAPVAAVMPSVTPKPASTSGDGLREIALDLIEKNPYQTRGSLPEQQLAELVASIAATGVVQPIVVRPISGGRFQLIAGQRRWEASRRAGKASIPAVVRQVSDQQAMEMTIIE